MGQFRRWPLIPNSAAFGPSPVFRRLARVALAVFFFPRLGPHPQPAIIELAEHADFPRGDPDAREIAPSSDLNRGQCTWRVTIALPLAVQRVKKTEQITRGVRHLGTGELGFQIGQPFIIAGPRELQPRTLLKHSDLELYLLPRRLAADRYVESEKGFDRLDQGCG